MWLAETAVDMEVPGNPGRSRASSLPCWHPGRRHEGIDATEPYWVNLSRGRRIAVFFYDGPLSGDVSFNDNATTNADAFIATSLPATINWDKEQRGEDQLCHHRHGWRTVWPPQTFPRPLLDASDAS